MTVQPQSRVQSEGRWFCCLHLFTADPEKCTYESSQFSVIIINVGPHNCNFALLDIGFCPPNGHYFFHSTAEFLKALYNTYISHSIIVIFFYCKDLEQGVCAFVSFLMIMYSRYCHLLVCIYCMTAVKIYVMFLWRNWSEKVSILLHLLFPGIIFILPLFLSICPHFSCFHLSVCISPHLLFLLSFSRLLSALWRRYPTGYCIYCLSCWMLMWPADACHSDWSRDVLKEGGRCGVVERERERERERWGRQRKSRRA